MLKLRVGCSHGRGVGGALRQRLSFQRPRVGVLGCRPPDPEVEVQLLFLSPSRPKLRGIFVLVLGPEALRGVSGCWTGKTSLSVAGGLCFLEQTPSSAGRPLCWGLLPPSHWVTLAQGCTLHSTIAPAWRSSSALRHPPDWSLLRFHRGTGLQPSCARAECCDG